MPNGARHYAFTLNNPKQCDYDRLAGLFESGSALYLIYGKETASTGTPHLQGHVYFSKKSSLKAAKAAIAGGAHLEVARSIQHSIEYCKKEGDYTEYGTSPSVRSGSGERNDLQLFRDAVREGTTDMSELREKFPLICARYPRFVLSTIRDFAPKVEVPVYELRDWQSRLVEILSTEPDPRQIVFVVDQKGNSGKTYFADYVETRFQNVQVMKPGKSADMAYEYNEKTSILIIDIPRSKMAQMEYLYSFLESIKDGRIFSPKYESVTKRFKPPHVIVMMNEEPDYLALSEDRYNVISTN